MISSILALSSSGTSSSSSCGPQQVNLLKLNIQKRIFLIWQIKVLLDQFFLVFLWFVDKFTCCASSASFAAYSSAILLKPANSRSEKMLSFHHWILFTNKINVFRNITSKTQVTLVIFYCPKQITSARDLKQAK